MCVEIKWQLLGVCSPFPTCGAWGLNLGHQTWLQAPSPAKPPCWSLELPHMISFEQFPIPLYHTLPAVGLSLSTTSSDRFLESHWIMWERTCSIWTWVICLIRLSPRSMCIVEDAIASSWYAWYIVLHSFTSRHMGCFHMLVTVNNVVIYIGGHQYFRNLDFNSFGSIPRNGITVHEWFCFYFQIPSKLFSVRNVSGHTLSLHWGSLFLRALVISLNNKGDMEGLECHFSLRCQCWASFQTLCHSYASSRILYTQVLCSFLNRVAFAFILLLSWQISLCIWWINPILDMQSGCSLFTVWICLEQSMMSNKTTTTKLGKWGSIKLNRIHAA